MADIYAKFQHFHKSDDPKRLQDLKKYLSKCRDKSLRCHSEDSSIILTLACKDGKREIVEYLLKDCAIDPNTTDMNRNAGIHYAASNGFMDIIQLLVDCRGHVNIRNGNDDTALTLAVKSDKLETVKLLLSLGADRDAGGIQPLDIARDRGNTHMIRLLQGTLRVHQPDSNPELQQLHQRLNSLESNWHCLTRSDRSNQSNIHEPSASDTPYSGDLQSQVASLNKQLKRMEEGANPGLSHLDQQLNSFDSKLDCLPISDEQSNQKNVYIDQLRDAYDTLAKRFGELENKFESMIGELMKVQEKTLITVDKRVDSIEKEMSEINKQLMERNKALMMENTSLRLKRSSDLSPHNGMKFTQCYIITIINEFLYIFLIPIFTSSDNFTASLPLT